MKINISFLKNQACQKNLRNRRTKRDWKLLDCYPRNEIVQDAEFHFNTMSPRKLRLLDYLTYKMGKHRGMVYITQDLLGAVIGCSRATISRLLLELEKEGLIMSNYRHMRSCLYKVTSWLFNVAITHRLKHLLPSLKLSILVALFPNSAPAKHMHTNVTHILNSSKYIYITKEQTLKKGGCMDSINPISNAIREIESISLTKWGQIRLSCFPDEAIRYADTNFKFATQIRDQFAFFCKLCVDYCTNNSLVPDWQYRDQLAFKYQMPADAPSLLPKTGQVKRFAPQAKNVSATPKYKIWKDPGHFRIERQTPPLDELGVKKALEFQKILGII